MESIRATCSKCLNATIHPPSTIHEIVLPALLDKGRPIASSASPLHVPRCHCPCRVMTACLPLDPDPNMAGPTFHQRSTPVPKSTGTAGYPRGKLGIQPAMPTPVSIGGDLRRDDSTCWPAASPYITSCPARRHRYYLSPGSICPLFQFRLLTPLLVHDELLATAHLPQGCIPWGRQQARAD